MLLNHTRRPGACRGLAANLQVLARRLNLDSPHPFCCAPDAVRKIMPPSLTSGKSAGVFFRPEFVWTSMDQRPIKSGAAGHVFSSTDNEGATFAAMMLAEFGSLYELLFFSS